MPKIIIRCPTFGINVPTGLTTEAIMFDSLGEELEIPLRCPACLRIHRWGRKDARVDRGDSGGCA
jgi:hypothetical protein